MQERFVALVTGGSRGIGAETALALAEHGYDIALTYRNKAARAQEVAASITQQGREALALCCDITQADEVVHLFQQVGQWRAHLDLLVLNASGGMERDLVAADPDYPMHINRDAQLALVKAALPLLRPGGVIVFVTSHWAHLYGQMQQLPAYEPVAESKHAGEQALRALQPDLNALGLRLLVVTGDLVEGTITPRLLERSAPGLIERRRTTQGALPTARDMGREIVQAALNPTLASGATIVIGASLESMLAP
ncbi:MAG TPA: SDR family oxidoreductase [Ktedonobacteraceae bacterium]|nr:SDR family oxidoreductase [Ktedonobacteraceae bacterium]